MPKKSARIILVTGATGNQGGAVLRKLREKNFAVRALTRDPNKQSARALVGQGTEVVRGDLNDPASLTRALDGVHGVFAVQTPYEEGVEAEVKQGIALVSAAARSRITHYVYSSVAAADQKTGIPHFESKLKIEEHLRGSGLRYSILRPAYFMENWIGFKQRVEQGTLRLPLSPDRRLQMVAVDDIGVVATMCFEKAGHWQGRAVELAGDELSMTELAQAFSRMTGRDVRYEQMPWDEFERESGPEVTAMYRWFEDVGYSVNIPALRQEHPNLMSFSRWLQANWPRSMTA